MDDRELLKTVMGIVGEENCRDDCAVLPCGDQLMVATTDMLHSTTDFVEGMTDWQIGWMSAAVTISDIASMGAAPKYLLIAVGLDRWEHLTAVMQGAQDCCRKFGAAIIGGDIDHHGELTVVTTGLGLVDREHIARREGARPGDLVCITGTPGQAQAWLDGYKQYEKALFEPQPRVAEGQAARTRGRDRDDGRQRRDCPLALRSHERERMRVFDRFRSRPAGQYPGTAGPRAGALWRRGLRTDLHARPGPVSRWPVFPARLSGKRPRKRRCSWMGSPWRNAGTSTSGYRQAHFS